VVVLEELVKNKFLLLVELHKGTVLNLAPNIDRLLVSLYYDKELKGGI
jgi:hypothetical protein